MTIRRTPADLGMHFGGNAYWRALIRHMDQHVRNCIRDVVMYAQRVVDTVPASTSRPSLEPT